MSGSETASRVRQNSFKFNNTDLLFDVIEGENHLATFACVFIFEDPAPAVEEIGTELEKWVELYPVLKCKRSENSWVPDTSYQQARQLMYVNMPVGSSIEDVERAIGYHISKPFISRRPHWRALYFDNIDIVRSVFVILMDHRLADAQGFLRMVINATSSIQSRRSASGCRASVASASSDFISTLPMTIAEDSLFDLDSDDDASSTSSSASERRSSNGSLHSSPRSKGLLQWTGKYAKMILSSRKILNTKGVGEREVALGELLNLDQLREVARALKVSINDVLMSCLAGAISVCAELKQPGVTKSEKDARLFIPISTREADDWDLANKICATVTSVPLDINDAIARVTEINKRQVIIKNSKEKSINDFISKNAGRLPKVFLRPIANLVKNSIHMVYDCNLLSGSANEIIIAGQPIKSFYFAFPPLNDCGGLGVATVAYNHTVSITITCDQGEFDPSAHLFLEAFHRQYQDLLAKLKNSGVIISFPQERPDYLDNYNDF